MGTQPSYKGPNGSASTIQVLSAPCHYLISAARKIHFCIGTQSADQACGKISIWVGTVRPSVAPGGKRSIKLPHRQGELSRHVPCSHNSASARLIIERCASASTTGHELRAAEPQVVWIQSACSIRQRWGPGASLGHVCGRMLGSMIIGEDGSMRHDHHEGRFADGRTRDFVGSAVLVSGLLTLSAPWRSCI